MYSIGDLSRRTGVKVPTIRYYEQAGLIAPAERTEGNQRRYEKRALDRLAFIRHGRDLGLSIEALRDLIDLSDHPEKPCARADAIAVEHLAAVRAKITQLQRLEHELERIVSHCTGHTVEDCYVLRALSDHALCDGEHARPLEETQVPTR
ncbi:MerR family transcriptional regulator [Rhizobium sp. Leaf384]|uniref:MerR family transcriptional regulator n=1 Tax=unclassified Rhizobium TaxID=2613769 RepID=UPI000712A716|nr:MULTISPECIES: helix-turn-helix domain-containing protein [unclassified Rhizobium]KQS77435.1 MerR family transcriptional regulator [Rhizobium sp. Leaf383]KQS80657.1 MerR family transcriptional regulator [Rhizobium sp. Leaf384]